MNGTGAPTRRGFLLKLGHRAERSRRGAHRRADRRLPPLAGAPQAHGGGLSWVALGGRRTFPRGRRAWPPTATRSRGPGTARRPTSPAGCAVCRRRLPGLRHQLRASRLPGALVSRNRGCSCVPATAAATTPTAPRLRTAAARPLPATSTRSRTGSLWIHAGMMPTLGHVEASARRGERTRRGSVRVIDSPARLARPARAARRAVRESAGHRVPRKSASWFYVFGSGALALLRRPGRHRHLPRARLRAVGRRGLPSLHVLNYQQPLGWFLRAMHGWGSNFMVAIVLIHMVQVFLFGAFKYPRELTWIPGVLLLLVTLGHGVHRARSCASIRTRTGASASAPRSWAACPFVGGRSSSCMLGGPIIAGETLSRFFALHVFVVPGL